MGVYRLLTRYNRTMIDGIHTDDFGATDPAHKYNGLAKLRSYIENLHGNVDLIEFDFFRALCSQESEYHQWQMTCSQSSLRKAQDIQVYGSRFLHFSSDSKVHYHRDYFDLVYMLHQYLPVLRSAIRTISRRLGA